MFDFKLDAYSINFGASIMGDARIFCFRIAGAAAALAFIGLAQPAAAQFNDTVAFTITDAKGETAVPPGCPRSRLYSVDPRRLINGSLPANDYSCYTSEGDVRGFAAYYAPYAIQAVLSYETITDNVASLTAAIKSSFPALPDRVQNLLVRRGWRFQAPDRCLTQGQCGAEYQPDPRGLSYQIWSRTDARGTCREASIAFRGSVSGLNSWLSNFETYVTAFDSEYSQFQREFSVVLNNVQKLRCRQIVTVGHSLGGGLGQFAALSAPRRRPVAKVVTFNTSPVSGVNLITDKELLNTNATGLTIDRVNQQGEALSFNFFKSRRQTRATVCDPLIRGVEFNASAGGSRVPLLPALERHEMGPLASRLVELSYKDTDPAAIPVKPKLPPVGRGACGDTRYEEEPNVHAPLVASTSGSGRRAFASTGLWSQDVAIYADAADRDGGLVRGTVHRSMAKQYVRRSGRIHLARS
ncbi:hypothetical protein BKD09_29070 [Bradyrhizobium japonicum]|uniref:Fungal lipase-like domain-containing protein n=2 Tax=Nitrobacteraceae TaxID=41294 RepID=A0A1L3FGG4_BRAJP|nr:hypothetical protein BKD09_29070 [Bradyrhizobium japonicum]